MRSILKIGFWACVCLGIAGCTSTGAIKNGPASKAALSICQGTKVSNAPAHDNKGAIQNYQPSQTIRKNIITTAPVAGCLSSAFGPRPNAGKNSASNRHKGIDIFTRVPKPVKAASDGIVVFIGRQTGYGKVVYINHANGVSTRYAHLSSFNKRIKKGDKISRNTQLGLSGKTGNANAIHLHYEILIDGKQKNPLQFRR